MVNKRLEALLKPKTESEVSFKVYSKATHYPDSIKIYKPFTPFKKIQQGYSPINRVASRFTEPITDYEDNLTRSIRRTKRNVKDIIVCNQFEHLVTFTFAEDRQNINRSKQKLKNWIKNQKRIHGDFQYVIVPEFHKDKESLHFHAVFKNYKGRITEGINPKTGRKVFKKGRQQYSLPGYKSGHSNLVYIDQSPKGHAGAGKYITKYITKDMVVLFGQNRYWASYGLLRPKYEYNPAKWYERIEPTHTIPLKEGVLYYYDKADVPKEYHK